jgi:hypothetical protein
MNKTVAQLLASYDNCVTVKYIVALDCTLLIFYVLLCATGRTAQSENFSPIVFM